jgi:hypothetical protein
MRSIERKRMVMEINLEEVSKRAAEDKFWALRAHAIQSYANVEQSLSALFATTGNIQSDIIGIIFFELSTYGRNKIIGSLIHKRYGENYKEYWGSLKKLLKDTTDERNKIVHWHSANFVNGQGEVIPKLMHPNLGRFNSQGEAIVTEDLLGFIKKCIFISRSLNMFNALLSDQLKEDQNNEKIWCEICQQKMVYPPDKNHPLAEGLNHSDLTQVFVLT